MYLPRVVFQNKTSFRNQKITKTVCWFFFPAARYRVTRRPVAVPSNAGGGDLLHSFDLMGWSLKAGTHLLYVYVGFGARLKDPNSHRLPEAHGVLRFHLLFGRVFVFVPH